MNFVEMVMTDSTIPTFETIGTSFVISGKPGVVWPVRNPGGYPNPEVLVGQTVLLDGVERVVKGVEAFLRRPVPDGENFALWVDQ